MFRRFQRSLLAAGLSAVGLVGFFGVVLSQVAADSRVVRPAINHGPAFDLSDRPIETTLHKYDHKSKNKYLTTGVSITFSFPAAYYYRFDNQRGGPQYEIELALDYQDLRLSCRNCANSNDPQSRRIGAGSTTRFESDGTSSRSCRR